MNNSPVQRGRGRSFGRGDAHAGLIVSDDRRRTVGSGEGFAATLGMAGGADRMNQVFRDLLGHGGVAIAVGAAPQGHRAAVAVQVAGAVGTHGQMPVHEPRGFGRDRRYPIVNGWQPGS